MDLLVGESFNQILIDSAIFFLGIIIAVLYVKKSCINKEKMVLYLYIFITYSSSNIFIKPVQDFLIPIPRTFIYYLKVFMGLSIYDLLIIIIFLVLYVRYFLLKKERGLFYSSNFIIQIWYKDIFLLLLSFVGYFLYDLGGNPTDFAIQVKTIRGVLTGFICLYITMYVCKKYQKKRDVMRLLSSLFFLNFINIASQFTSSFFLHGISWERGGHSVVVLDQTDSMMGIFMLPLIYAKNKMASKWMIFTCYFTVFLLVYNYIKFLYLSAALVLAALCVFALVRGRITMRLFTYSVVVGIVAFLFALYFITSSGGDKMSRIGQQKSLIEAFEDNPMNAFVGIGYGGLIKRQTLSEDGGEIRAVDLEKDGSSKYQAAYQVPYLGVLKTSGLIGMVIVFCWTVNALIYSYRYIKYGWYYCAAIVSIPIWSFGTCPLLASDPQTSIFYCEAYLVMILFLRVKLSNG